MVKKLGNGFKDKDGKFRPTGKQFASNVSSNEFTENSQRHEKVHYQKSGEHLVNELDLYLMNTESVYRGIFIPYVKGFAKDMKRNSYTTEKAVKIIYDNTTMHLLNDYNRYWKTDYDMDRRTRMRLAEKIVNNIEREIDDQGIDEVWKL